MILLKIWLAIVGLSMLYPAMKCYGNTDGNQLLYNIAWHLAGLWYMCLIGTAFTIAIFL